MYKHSNILWTLFLQSFSATSRSLRYILLTLLLALSTSYLMADMYLAGTMNDWRGDDPSYKFSDNKLEVQLSGSTTYSFKIVDNGAWRSCNTTISTTAINYELNLVNVEGNDIVLVTGEAGTYIFQYSYYDDKHHISVYYPQSRLTKGTYLYVDARNTNWVSNAGVGFAARYFYKYYDNGVDYANLTCTTPLEYQVHYTIVPNHDYLGQIQIERKNPEDLDGRYWDIANQIAAYTRTSSAQNCLSMQNATGSKWSDFDPVWTTYCPIKESTTISDNGTVLYGGEGTDANPYLVENATAINLLAASTDYIVDANMTTKYRFYKDDAIAQDSETSTYGFTASGSAGTIHKINVNGYNFYNETSGTEKFSTLLFYRTVTCYTVTYDANNGSGSLPAASGNKYIEGTNITLANNAGGDGGSLHRDGYVFVGWNTAANGSGTHYDAGATLIGLSENTRLYAQWVGLTTPTVTPATTNWPGSSVDISLSATSTYLAEPIVIFYVTDENTSTTYEVMAAPGTIGAPGDNYITTHTATFTANIYGTYSVIAKLYEGKFIDNFESDYVYWNSIGYGLCDKEDEGINGGNTILKITRSTTPTELGERHTAWTTTTPEGGTHTIWGYHYNYIHMRYRAPQAEEPKVQYVDDETTQTYKNTTLPEVSANTWHQLSFEVTDGVVDLIYPFIKSEDGNAIYIDDVVLSNQASLTPKVTTESVSTTIYSLTALTATPSESEDYTGTPLSTSLTAVSTGVEIPFVIFYVSDGATTYELTGTPSVVGSAPLFTTTHTATFTTSVPSTYTVTAKLFEGKLVDNFDVALAYWKTIGSGTYDAQAANPNKQAVNGSDVVMRVTRAKDTGDYETVQTKQTPDNDATTNWNLNYQYIYISMYSTFVRGTKMKYSDDYGISAEVTSTELPANAWTRIRFERAAANHEIDFILPFMTWDGDMYMDDIILSNEATMSEKATNPGEPTTFIIHDNKYYFHGQDGSSTAWNVAANWNRGALPSSTSEVFILAPAEIPTSTTAFADKVNIVAGSGKLTINPNAGLVVNGTIKSIANLEEMAIQTATTPSDLILLSSAEGNASLVFSNDANQATVQMYSKATIGENWNWQYMTTPFTDGNALHNYYGSYLYKWGDNGWEEVPNGAAMVPFAGYCITQETATIHVMDGTLVPNTSVTVTIGDDEDKVIGNSWTAPIDVASFTAETFTVTPATVFLFNTGHSEEDTQAGTEAGTYVSIPVHAAEYTGDRLISPLQSFFVSSHNGASGTVTLNYDQLVRPTENRSVLPGPMRDPKHAQTIDRPDVLKIWANGTRYVDKLVLLAREDFSLGFDNGWDGEKLSLGMDGPSVYAINNMGVPQAVNAVPELEGTIVAFHAGAESSYTLTFEYEGADVLYLNDLQLRLSTLISNENSYTFSSDAEDSDTRFIISATPIDDTPTGNRPQQKESSSSYKILINNHLYLINKGRVYSVEGALVK